MVRNLPASLSATVFGRQTSRQDFVNIEQEIQRLGSLLRDLRETRAAESEDAASRWDETKFAATRRCESTMTCLAVPWGHITVASSSYTHAGCPWSRTILRGYMWVSSSANMTQHHSLRKSKEKPIRRRFPLLGPLTQQLSVCETEARLSPYYDRSGQGCFRHPSLSKEWLSCCQRGVCTGGTQSKVSLFCVISWCTPLPLWLDGHVFEHASSGRYLGTVSRSTSLWRTS